MYVDKINIVVFKPSSNKNVVTILTPICQTSKHFFSFLVADYAPAPVYLTQRAWKYTCVPASAL